MESKDPLTRLSIECAALIFAYLSPPEIVRCQCINKGWRDALNNWIISHGLRLHYRDFYIPHKTPATPKTSSSSSLAIQKFKDLAALDKNLHSGKAVHAERYPAAKLFTSAGKYAAWFRLKRGVFAQCLTYDEDGSARPQEILDIPDFDPEGSAVCHLALNEEGYLHVRLEQSATDTAQRFIRGYTDIIISVDTGEKVWTRYQAVSIGGAGSTSTSSEGIDTPLAIGKERVYFASPPHLGGVRDQTLSGYDFAKTRKWLPYQVPLDSKILPIPHSDPFVAFSFLQQTVFLQSRGTGDELLLHLKVGPETHPATAKIQIINTQTGNSVQSIQTQVIGRRHVYLVPAPGSHMFAVVSHVDNLGQYIMIQKFVQGTDSSGEFREVGKGVDMLYTENLYKNNVSVAVDPWRKVVAALLGMNTPSITTFKEVDDEETWRSRVGDVFGRHGVTVSADRLFHAPCMERIMLRDGGLRAIEAIQGPTAYRALVFYGPRLVAYDYGVTSYVIEFSRRVRAAT